MGAAVADEGLFFRVMLFTFRANLAFGAKGEKVRERVGRAPCRREGRRREKKRRHKKRREEKRATFGVEMSV